MAKAMAAGLPYNQLEVGDTMDPERAQVDFRPCEREFFDCDAVELASKLLGKYLWCPRSDIDMIRVVETEAYPPGDGVYATIFGDDAAQQAIPSQPGVLFRLNSSSHHPNPRSSTIGYPDYLYITAGNSDSDSALKSVVLIRSCMPMNPDASKAKIEERLGYTYATSPYLKNNLLINPHVVSRVVSRDFDGGSNRVLYEEGGFQLFYREDAFNPVYVMMHGNRVLDQKGKSRNPYGSGLNSIHRFALQINDINYSYTDMDDLSMMYPIW